MLTNPLATWTETGLWAAAEADPTPNRLRILADFHEEQGSADLAFALRWCARKGKWPMRYVVNGGWYWTRGNFSGHALHHGLYEVMLCGHGGTLRESLEQLAAGLAVLHEIRDG